MSKLSDPLIAVLGLAYKAGSASTKNSPALALLRSLPNVRVRVFDPVVDSLDESVGKVEFATDVISCCRGADAVAIMSPWDQFESIDLNYLARELSGDVVIDPYGVLDDQSCSEAKLKHSTLGVGQRSPD